jgi:hypothetical protein
MSLKHGCAAFRGRRCGGIGYYFNYIKWLILTYHNTAPYILHPSTLFRVDSAALDP